MKKVLLATILSFCCALAAAQETKEINIWKFKVEVNNQQIDYDQTISDHIVDFEAKEIVVYKHTDFSYVVEFLFKRKGNRIKVRRISRVVMNDGTVINGNRKKEVQFMSSSAPGEFEFPVAENIVLDKASYSTFFISYRVKVTYS